MEYNDKVRMAVLQGLVAHFKVMAIDIVCMSVSYQHALHGTDRIMELLTDSQKDELYMEYQNMTLHTEKIFEIQETIDKLKKHEFANEDAIKVQQQKLAVEVVEIQKSMMTFCPNLLNMLEKFCHMHVHKQMFNE